MIIFGIINVPGTVHDPTMASFFGVYDKLKKVYDETGLKCIMDSAFCASKYEFITKSLQNFEQCHFNDMQTMAINSAVMSM
jgi:hypothetical protein